MTTQELLEREIQRLELEYLKGQEELQNVRNRTKELMTSLVQIEGSVITLRSLITKDGERKEPEKRITVPDSLPHSPLDTQATCLTLTDS